VLLGEASIAEEGIVAAHIEVPPGCGDGGGGGDEDGDASSSAGSLYARCGGRCVLLCGRFDWDLPMQHLFLSVQNIEGATAAATRKSLLRSYPLREWWMDGVASFVHLVNPPPNFVAQGPPPP
jgi:hypothetical protein